LVFKLRCTFVWKFGEILSQTEPNGVQTGQSAGTRTTSRCARHVGPPLYPHARRGSGIPRGPRSGAVGTVRLRVETHSRPLGRCHAAAAHSPAREPPFAIGRRPPHVANRLRAHAVATVANEARVKPPRRVAWPIKALPVLSSCAHAVTSVRRRLPLAPPVNSLLRSRPWPANDSKFSPSPHLSSHAHPMA
jgi:hypothetical protein